jgi:hypothetical protein
MLGSYEPQLPESSSYRASCCENDGIRGNSSDLEFPMSDFVA